MPIRILEQLKTDCSVFSQGYHSWFNRLMAGTLAAVLISGALLPVRAGITVVSYLLRDRAVVLDSLVMRKQMFFAFKLSQPLAELKNSAVVGILTHGEQDRVLAQDTAYIFDEAAGNLGFGLPFEIPDGKYHLEIKLLSPGGEVQDSYSGDFDRSELKPYFNRAISYWDFTTPYAHLECRGYGDLTYSFSSGKSIGKLQALEIQARITSDNSFPGRTKVSLNGVELGEFELPAANNSAPQVVSWRVESPQALSALSIRSGENSLSFSITRRISPRGFGFRIFSDKNSRESEVEPGVPITLTVIPAGGESAETVFRIPVWGEEGEHIQSKFTIPGPDSFSEEIIEPEQVPFPLAAAQIKQGYIVFRRDFLRYVYPWTIPAEREQIDSLHLRMSRNDFEPLTFSIYPVRELGEVSLTLSDLKGTGGALIRADNMQVHVAKTVKMRTGRGTQYRLIPRMLERTQHAFIPVDYTTRFWITLHVGNTVAPGRYTGVIHLQPQKEQAVDIPFSVEILPIALEPVPGITYSMFMTYEFFELESKDWNDEQRRKIYRDGVNVFRDFKNHGLTTVDVSSPYYFQWNRDGTPRMEHFKGMIRGAKEVGFTDPVFWYFAHYVQAAKSFHPGNVLSYDPAVHPKRAAFLVRTAQRLARELDGPPVYFVPIDEPRVASRQRITLELLKAIKQVPGVVTQVSTDIGGKLLAIENNSGRYIKRLGPGEKVRKSDREVWEYNNAVVHSLNPGYSRYIYGYYTWRQDLDGMNSWGFNTAENSRGNPYEDLDHDRNDWNLAYPHAGGPLPTPNWEALREGIDDVRYVYQLERLIKQKAADFPAQTAGAGKFLDELRGKCDFEARTIINEFGEWNPERFNSIRSDIISWILKLKDL